MDSLPVRLMSSGLLGFSVDALSAEMCPVVEDGVEAVLGAGSVEGDCC